MPFLMVILHGIMAKQTYTALTWCARLWILGALCALDCSSGGRDGSRNNPSGSTGGGAAGATGGTLSAAGGALNIGGSTTGGEQATRGSTAVSAATGGLQALGGASAIGGLPATGGSQTTGGSKATGGTSTTGGSQAIGGAKATGGSTGMSGSSATSCDDASLVWKTANKTNFTSYPDPGSEECIKYNGCAYEGLFAACDQQESQSWVQAHNIVSVFPDFNTLKLHDLCLKAGSKTMIVTVLDTCADSDCSGCCTANKGTASELIDIESYTDQRFGVPDGSIQWADLGTTKGTGCH